MPHCELLSYLEGLLEYLEGYLLRVKPLFDLKEVCNVISG